MNQQVAKEFVPSKECLDLFSKYCHVEDVEEIKRRVYETQRKALETYPYRCVQEFRFAEPRMMSHSFYNVLLQERKKLQNWKFLDIGCCMGTDIRKLLADEIFIAENVKGLELEKDFIHSGYELFSDRDSLKEVFQTGDSLKEEGLPFPEGFFDIIYCGSVFHLLTEPQGQRLASNVFKALDGQKKDQKGIFFGRTVGSGSENPFTHSETRRAEAQLVYLHSANSMTLMLKSVGFKDVLVTAVPSDIPWQTPAQDAPTELMSMMSFIAYKY